MFRTFRSLALILLFLSGCTAAGIKTTATPTIKRSTSSPSSSSVAPTPGNGEGPGIGISGTVKDVSYSNGVITLNKTAGEYKKIALGEGSELVDPYGNRILLQDIQPGMTIQAVGKAGKEALIARKVLLPRPTSDPSTFQFSDDHLTAVDALRSTLGLPDLPLGFVTRGTDPNSPSGILPVAKYQDTKGRIFSVDPKTNRVIEMDARLIISDLSSDATPMSPEGREEKAREIFSATVPDFIDRDQLTYEQGKKSDVYFFKWYDESAAEFLNRPRLQIGLHQSGILFSYYNSLSLEN